jgi:hypothetical protein
LKKNNSLFSKDSNVLSPSSDVTGNDLANSRLILWLLTTKFSVNLPNLSELIVTKYISNSALFL